MSSLALKESSLKTASMNQAPKKGFLTRRCPPENCPPSPQRNSHLPQSQAMFRRIYEYIIYTHKLKHISTIWYIIRPNCHEKGTLLSMETNTLKSGDREENESYNIILQGIRYDATQALKEFIELDNDQGTQIVHTWDYPWLHQNHPSESCQWLLQVSFDVLPHFARLRHEMHSA